jgi:hypothetical protein
MNAATLKNLIASLPNDREAALELYQEMLIKQNQAQGDEFYRRQETVDAVETALIGKGFLPARKSLFAAY